jgi:type IV secretory pathway TrbL component
MFYFQSMFQQVYNGISGSTVLPAVQQIAEGILLLAALFAVYEAYAKGGDARTLALAGVRYLFMGLLISQYPNVFRNVNNAFANVAQAIAPADVWTNFRDQVQGYLSANNGQGAWWNWVVGGVAGTFSLIFQAIAVLVFPISYAIFSFFYSMYGAVLYVAGPLVLALYPALGVGQLARTFMVNLLVWNAWGIIYAIISQLLTIMSANSLNSIFTSQSFGGAFQGASQMLLISLSSILLSIMILLIPFIAKRVVSGDVGSTMLAVVGIAAAAAQAAVAGWAGMQSGAASAAGGGGGDGGGGGGGGVIDGSGGSNRSPSPPPEGNEAALGGEAGASGHAPPAPGGTATMDASTASGSGSGVAAEENRPPTDSSGAPRQSHGRSGHFGRYSIPYAVGRTVGTWAGATHRTMSSAFRSNQKEEQEV